MVLLGVAAPAVYQHGAWYDATVGSSITLQWPIPPTYGSGALRVLPPPLSPMPYGAMSRTYPY
eukprot:3752004-Rhodomonas_salina.2